MRLTGVVLFLLIACVLPAQVKLKATGKFIISGNVKKATTFSLKDATNFTSYSVDSLVIYNHLHERKRVVRDIKGVLLKDILEKSGLNEEKPKLFSEFYFTCIATDGYKVVYSWNELFNTDIGDQVMIITEADGRKADGTNDDITMLSALDKATGRRFVKNLLEIKVERVK